MSDLDDLKALLDRWEVPYTAEQTDVERGYQERKPCLCLLVEENTYSRTPRSPRIDGYTGFYTRFEFDLDGTFDRMGAWE